MPDTELTVLPWTDAGTGQPITIGHRVRVTFPFPGPPVRPGVVEELTGEWIRVAGAAWTRGEISHIDRLDLDGNPDSILGDLEELRRTTGAQLRTITELRELNQRQRDHLEERDADLAAARDGNVRLAGRRDELLGMLRAADAEAEEYRAQVRSRLIEFATAHNLHREDLNELMTDLQLAPWLRSYRVPVTLRASQRVLVEIDAPDPVAARRQLRDDPGIAWGHVVPEAWDGEDPGEDLVGQPVEVQDGPF